MHFVLVTKMRQAPTASNIKRTNILELEDIAPKGLPNNMYTRK